MRYMQLTLNRIAAGLVGVAMVAGLAAAFAVQRAHAAELSFSELVELFIALEVIPADKADEARAVLAGQDTATPAAPATTMSCNFARNLTTGDTGADVMDLQKLLNSKGFAVSAAGAPGSAGMETQYYGPATAAAVAAMQTMYASEILAPLGLTTGTGYFGASTRAKANALCAAAPTTPEVPELPGEEEEEVTEEEDETTLSGEASLTAMSINTADEDEIEEGAEDAVVAETTYEFSDGDAMITRIDIVLVGSGDEQDPWDTFETASLWVDGEMVAEKSIDSRSDYLSDDDGSVRFTGLDIVAMEDEELDVQVAVTVQGSVDGTDDEEAWTVAVDAIRFVDGDDVTTTETSAFDIDDTAAFVIKDAGADDEIIVKTSTSDPDSSIIKVEDNAKSDWVTVFVFDLDTKDSVSDITLNNVYVTVDTTLDTLAYSTLVDDARIVIDGTTVDSTVSDVTDAASTTNAAVINFDVDGDVVIDAGDRVKAELQLRFKALDPSNEGARIQASVTSVNADAIDAEGADDLGIAQLSGAATGDVHQVMTTGIFAEIVSTDVDTKSNGTVDDSVGEFTIKFDVTAFEETYYISATNTAVFDIDILQAGTASTTASYSVAVSSTASKDGSSYRIDEGETETFTLVITYEPNYAANYSALLNSVDYGSSALASDDQTPTSASPAEDFETDPVYINA
jgi:hypothetical protein